MSNLTSVIRKWFHVCKIKWEPMYGFTPFGLGGHEVEMCYECGKITGKMRNFVRDTEYDDYNKGFIE